MSPTTPKADSLHEQPTTTDCQPKCNGVTSVETIRQRVENRHWQLFEARLKSRLPEVNKENYTSTNNYRVIDRLKKVDQPQPPIEPHRRWETFCNQVTHESKESNRLMSIFHNVWQKNWHSKPIDKTLKRPQSDSKLNENTLLNTLSINDNDRKLISSIINRTNSQENMKH